MARVAMMDDTMANWKGTAGGGFDSLSFLRRLGVANSTMPSVISDDELASSSTFGSTIDQSVIYNPSVEAVPNKLAKDPSAVFHGQATVYWQNGDRSACGAFESDHDLLVALDSRLFGDASTPSAYCGRTLTVTNTGKHGRRQTVKARVADIAYLESAHSLDLSVAAFEKLSNLDMGIARISWHFDA
ncbi:hypothetical protein OIO90_004564 [Microbotryomycetes sp. JL221]|nr:hypothetical protein OIO90_004564 [Microbotryomycetes sp. JL221]